MRGPLTVTLVLPERSQPLRDALFPHTRNLPGQELGGHQEVGWEGLIESPYEGHGSFTLMPHVLGSPQEQVRPSTELSIWRLARDQKDSMVVLSMMEVGLDLR